MIDIFFMVLQFVPVANILETLFSSADPVWWTFGLKIIETVVALQLLMPVLEKITRKTANTWGDGWYARLKMILAFLMEIIGALIAIDPRIGSRIAAITGPRDKDEPTQNLG